MKILTRKQQREIISHLSYVMDALLEIECAVPSAQIVKIVKIVDGATTDIIAIADIIGGIEGMLAVQHLVFDKGELVKEVSQ